MANYKFEETSPYLENNRTLFDKPGNGTWKKKLKDADKLHLSRELQLYYFDKGWWLKLIARNVLGCTYSVSRCVFDLLGMEIRRGTNVKTDFTSELRRVKATHENKNAIGFNSPKVKRYAKSDTRGCQGYFYNPSIDKHVWLRSSWEFIFAKFLIKIGVKWDVEIKYFNLVDGTRYSPDFYLFDNDGNLTTIVEIKGYFDNHAYKAEMLKENYFSDSSVKIVLIREIKRYIETGSNLGKELKQWKSIRKSKDCMLNQSV
jgi:hypothetical protein